jgi:predicted lipoprotein with Yx(FWY)xxD motif
VPGEETSTPDVPPTQKIDLFKQTKGVLSQAEGMFVYRFDPDDLLTTKPLRLMEVIPGK